MELEGEETSTFLRSNQDEATRQTRAAQVRFRFVALLKKSPRAVDGGMLDGETKNRGDLSGGFGVERRVFVYGEACIPPPAVSAAVNDP